MPPGIPAPTNVRAAYQNQRFNLTWEYTAGHAGLKEFQFELLSWSPTTGKDIWTSFATFPAAARTGSFPMGAGFPYFVGRLVAVPTTGPNGVSDDVALLATTDSQQFQVALKPNNVSAIRVGNYLCCYFDGPENAGTSLVGYRAKNSRGWFYPGISGSRTANYVDIYGKALTDDLEVTVFFFNFSASNAVPGAPSVPVAVEKG